MKAKIGFKGAAISISIIAAILLISSVYAFEVKVDADKPIFLTASITSMDNSTITVTTESGESMKLFAAGRWILISNEVKRLAWTEARSYLQSGDALIVMTTLSKGNVSKNVILGVKQNDVILLRPLLIRHYVKAHRHAATYLSFRGTLADKGENYMILERDGAKILAVTNGDWIKAGGGEVTWKDVSNEFQPGDEIRLFYHSLIVMKGEFAENFGINGFIWGYSGAIIDLTSGTTLSRK
ncbi:MAG: hypothetical protein J7K49_04350 [Thaumarchaeota archaeon]|nr:hypothetical protein [Nitrososphaerota archaeon]